MSSYGSSVKAIRKASLKQYEKRPHI